MKPASGVRSRDEYGGAGVDEDEWALAGYGGAGLSPGRRRLLWIRSDNPVDPVSLEELEGVEDEWGARGDELARSSLAFPDEAGACSRTGDCG